MIVQNAYVYIQIGLCVRALRYLAPPLPSSFATEMIETFRSNLVRAGFDVSLAAMQSVAFGDMMVALESADKNAPLAPAVASLVVDQFVSLENVLFAEAITKRVYILPNRRFNTGYLLADQKKLLKAGAFEKLEEVARNDFASSCRCILFGEATAAAFHILRATESVLKSYYFHHRRQKRLDRPMWGPMVEQLCAKAKHKPPESLLASLDLIRSAYRNPTQHPEAIYEIDSAQDLFGVCLDVIGKMTEEIVARATP